ncbi:MAG: iron-siderophore ABC transporter substrate-binding protein [Actinomycetota bacterium]|nr:iron-siderophore ABC transporter substrate-binding protein [Actinomycetota bacterium]
MRRARVLGVLTGVLCSVIVACGSSPNTNTDGPSTPSGGSAFPVTIEHKFGSTTIPAPPKRVVTVGDEDIAVALGITPVGIVRNTTYDSGVAPWLEDRIDLAKTTLIDVPAGAEGEGAAGVNIEQVAALNPDLILAVNDFGLELDYPKLSQIAPTVGYATEWGAQSWQEQTMVDARALGLEERGRQVVAETEAAIRAVRDANPSLAGKTVTYSFAYEPGKIVTLKSDQDPSVKLLQELGMQLPTSVRQLPDIAPGNPGGDLSFENMSVLDADIVIMLYATNELQRQVEGLQLFRSLRGVRDDRYIVIDLPTASALRTPTVLSIRWGLEQIRPSLARVATS